MTVRHPQYTQGLLLTAEVLQQPLFFYFRPFSCFAVEKSGFRLYNSFRIAFYKMDVRPLAAVRQRH